MNTQVSGTTLSELHAKAAAEITRFVPADILASVGTAWSISQISPVPSTAPDGDAVKYVAQIQCVLDIDTV